MTRPLLDPLEGRRLFAAVYTLIDLGQAASRDVASGSVADGYFAGVDVKNGKATAFYSALGASTHTPLAPLPGYTNSVAWGLSGPDAVFGQSFNSSVNQSRVTLWKNGTPIDLGAGVARNGDGIYVVGTSPDGFATLFAQGMSPSKIPPVLGSNLPDLNGDIATDTANGVIVVGQSNGHAFYSQGGGMFDLTDIGGGTTGITQAVSDQSGIAVGAIDNRAFRTAGLQVNYLPTLGVGVSQSSANDINDRGEIVGQSVVGSQNVATLWEGSSAVALSSRVVNLGGWTLNRADSVSNTGEIVGFGRVNGEQHLFALVPGGVKVSKTGTMTVTGSDDDDSLTVGFKNGKFRASINGSLVQFPRSRVKRINVNAGGGDDVVTLGAGVPGATIYGGAGNDVLSGGDFADKLFGEAGNDKLIGYGSRDYLDGADGADTLLGGSSIDTILGGNGNDTSDYDKREKRTSIEHLL